MMSEPKGYWSSVFYQTTVLLRSRQGVSADDAFRMARHMIDENLGGESDMSDTLPFSAPSQAPTLALAP